MGPVEAGRRSPATLSVAGRAPGPALSEVVDFLVPGLEGLHFVAYGSSQGSVVVACARQLDHIGSAACQDRAEQQQLQTLLVLDLQRPASAATALTFSAHGSSVTAAPSPEPGTPLSDAVLHVAFGGGPHLLLAACTRDTLTVVSLEGLAAHLFHQQTSGCGASLPAQQPLWQQLAAVHSGHAELLAISWTQQLDGILASSADGTLTMWHLKPLAPPTVPEQQPLVPPGSASGPPAAALRAAWSVHAPLPQRLVCAGVTVYAPSATAAGRAADAPSVSSAASSLSKAGSSSVRDGGAADGERYASVWWPQAREQRQRHYAGGMPSVGQEKLRHPAAVIGLQWSPGVLQKDALAFTTGGGGGRGGPGGASPGGAIGSEPGSPSVAAAAAATEAEDHPALMTLSGDGTVRVWVETLVLTESGLSPAQPSSEARGVATPPRGPPQLQRRSPGYSPGSGSPGAAPSSPRDVRAAAAAAAALGAAAPDITSYFCMALLVDPAATAAGAAAAAAAAAGAGPSTSGALHQPPPHVSLWARHAGPLLLHKQQRRVAPPVLWLFAATVDRHAGDSGCRLLLHLHAVRGLAAIVMSAGYGGSLSSTSGGSSSTRPAAVLWGQHSWELPAAAAGMDPAQLLQRLCCWVSDEEGYPLLHAFTSSSSSDAPGCAGSGRLVLAGRTFSTVQQDGPSHMQVHKQLAVASSWQAAAVAHEQPITAFAAAANANGSGGSSSSIGLVASCDGSGRLLLWEGPHLKHLAAVPAAAVGSTAALAWLPLASPSPAAGVVEDARREQWLAVGSGSMLQIYCVGSRQPVAVATAAVQAGCSTIKSLHAFSSSGSSCVLLAVCSSSAGRGCVLCGWRCSASAAASGSSTPSSMQLALAGTAAVPAAAAVSSAATAGSKQLLVGTADGSVLLLSMATDGNGVQPQPVAHVQEDGAVTVVAADEGCLHLASTTGGSVSIWSACPGDTNGSSSGSGDAAPTCHYSRAACVQLPPASGQASAAAWLCHSVAPCLAVATNNGTLLLLSAVRAGRSGSSGWQWVARLPPTAAASAGVRHLAAGSGCSTVVAVEGNQLLRMSEAVLVPGGEQEGGGTQLFGRLLLDLAGPLPQYHPTFLSALLLSGKRAMAAAVLQRLAAWLAALKQRTQEGAAASPPPSPLAGASAAAAGAGSGSAGTEELPGPLFSGLPLAEMVDPELTRLQQLLERRSLKAAATAAAGGAGAAHPPLALQQQQLAASSLESGILDMSAFGMAPAAPAQQQPVASSLDTGMLDMAAFGMAPPVPAEPAQQQPAASSLDTGMLDMAAFGMTPPAPAEPAQQQPTASSLDTGMLDMAAFGMAPPTAAPAAPAPAAAQRPLNGSSSGGILAPRSAAAAAGPSAGMQSSQPRAQQLPPPKQPLLPAQQLRPVAADCYRQLQELLLVPRPQEEGANLGHSLGSGGSAQDFTSSSASRQAWDAAATPPALAAAIPGLSLEETGAVLAIAEAFSQTEASGSSGAQSSAPVDAAAAQFIAAVSLACATSGQEAGSSGSGSGAAAGQQQQLQQQRVTVKNAAGVAYTLAPSAVVRRPGDCSSDDNGSSMGQRWGLLAGLDASAVLWALLSGTEEQLLLQALRRLQQLEATHSAAAAAAVSADNATFLAARTTKADPASDQPPTWPQLRRLGAGFWLRDRALLASTAERLAKQQFAARRNADDCALLYSALGKRSVLQGLYRSTQNRKLSEFLSRDFEEEQHCQAAQKNAFVLLGQHRHELAAAFFILGDCPREAIGVAANEMRDPQLALLLCRLLFGGTGSEAELSLLQQQQLKAEKCSSGDAAAAAAACCWLQADGATAITQMLSGEQARLAAAAAPEHAAQLLPLLHLLLTAVPPAGDAQAADWRQQLQRCLWALAAALGRCGLHALAVQAAAAAQLGGGSSGSKAGPVRQQRQALLQQHILAEALLSSVLEQHGRQRRHLEADAAYQLELLQQQGVPVDAPAVLSRLRRMRRGILPADEAVHHQHDAWAPPMSALSRQHSSVGSVGGSSYRSSEPYRWTQQRGHGTFVVGDGQVLFKVDNDKLEAVACCPLMSPDVLGRPVVVASHRMGLVEGQLHVVLPEPLSPLHEVPDSPEAAAAAALEEEQNQRGGMFSRLLSQLFDQSTWQQDPTWHHGTAEFDVIGAGAAVDAQVSISSPHGSVLASNITTGAMAAHPSKQLYLTGCSSGLLHLWQFGEQRALATYTPVPGSELANISRTFSGLLSFSRSFKTSAAAPRLANWGKAAAVRFAPNGERFAAVGEGGVVATWRLDAPSRKVEQADADGHGCAEWWHQALSKQGCAVDFVGGSSSVLVVGGRSLPTSAAAGGSASNLSVWDTMAPTASSCVGRLVNHQTTVTAVSMLPGGWLLAAGDAEGSLSCTDLRMMGGSSGPRLLWSVKAARGALTSIVAVPSSSSSPAAGLNFGGGGGSALLATAGADGAVRIWRGADGRLLQSIESAHFTTARASSRRSSHDGGVAPATPPNTHPVPATGLAACEEGLVSCGADGCVRLHAFL